MKRLHTFAAKISVLLFSVVTVITCSSLLFPPSAHAQGGVPLWTNQFQASGPPGAARIAVDGNGNVFVLLTSFGSGSFEPTIIKCSNAGVPLWTNFSTGSLIATDGAGNVFVTDIGVSTI